MAEKLSLNESDFRSKVNLIVEEMNQQAASKESVKEILSELKSKYGLKPTTVRKVATIIFNANFDEFAEKEQELRQLLTIAVS